MAYSYAALGDSAEALNNIDLYFEKQDTGFLVAKDVLSRMTYIAILRFTRTADSMIAGFKEIFKQFEQHNPGLKVTSIAFDQEPSVLSKKVQNFFKENSFTLV